MTQVDVEALVSTLQRLLSVCEGGEYQPERVEEAARELLAKHKALNLPQAVQYRGYLINALDLLERVWTIIADGGAEGMRGELTWAIGDLLRDAGRISVESSDER